MNVFFCNVFFYQIKLWLILNDSKIYGSSILILKMAGGLYKYLIILFSKNVEPSLWWCSCHVNLVQFVQGALPVYWSVLSAHNRKLLGCQTAAVRPVLKPITPKRIGGTNFVHQYPLHARVSSYEIDSTILTLDISINRLYRLHFEYLCWHSNIKSSIGEDENGWYWVWNACEGLKKVGIDWCVLACCIDMY